MKVYSVTIFLSNTLSEKMEISWKIQYYASFPKKAVMMFETYLCALKYAAN